MPSGVAVVVRYINKKSFVHSFYIHSYVLKNYIRSRLHTAGARGGASVCVCFGVMLVVCMRVYAGIIVLVSILRVFFGVMRCDHALGCGSCCALYK